jgi:HK97 family phage prohead protease
MVNTMSETIFNTLSNNISVGVTFEKVDVENRTVSGFATLDNVDAHGDIIDSTASMEAFKRFRGGLREMHTNNAVGTVVKFEEAKKYAEEDEKFYTGVYITAKVSRGAQDTWEKVLDGTYKGFSIGGKIKKRETLRTSEGKTYPVIKEYDLIEVSLVDNPANPLTTVMTVKKSGDIMIYNDIDDLNKSSYNILYNTSTGDVVLSESEDMDGFVNIGWSDGEPTTEDIKNAVDSYKTSQYEDPDDEITLVLHKSDVLKALAQAINSKEVLDMATDIEKDATDEVVTEETVEKSTDDVTEEAAEETVESEVPAEDVEEGDDEVVAEEEEAGEEESEDVEKSEDALDPEAIVSKVQDVVTEAVAKAVDAAVESKNAVESVKASFDETIDTLNKEVSGLKETLEGLTNRLKAVESETAVRKSSDILPDEEGDDEEGDFWRGSGFLSATDLIKG